MGEFDSSTENIASAGTEITYYFGVTGTDDATNKYFFSGKSAIGVKLLFISPDKNITIESINGIAPKNPRTVSTAGYPIPFSKIPDMTLRTIKLKTSVATTRITVDAFYG